MYTTDQKELAIWLNLIFNFPNIKILSCIISITEHGKIYVDLKKSQNYSENKEIIPKIDIIMIEYDPVSISNPKLAIHKHNSTLELVQYTQLSRTVELMVLNFDTPGLITKSKMMTCIGSQENDGDIKLIDGVYPYIKKDDYQVENNSTRSIIFELEIFAGDEEKLLIEKITKQDNSVLKK